VPVPPVRIGPPIEAAYQSIVKPAPGSSTEIVAVPPAHVEAPVEPVGTDGSVLTTIAPEIVLVKVHPFEFVTTT